MLGNSSVPHWFRRAISVLELHEWRIGSSPSRAQRAAEHQKRAARRLAAAQHSARSYRNGPKVLEEIVMSWEEQNAHKALAAGGGRKKALR